MNLLRDGSVVDDVRLDRLEWFDERSRAFGIGSAGQKPRSHQWKVGPVLDQGRDGACAAFAFAHALLAEPPFPAPAVEGWPLGVYHDAQRIDEYPGGEYPEATPRMSGTSVLAAAKVLTARGFLAGYRWAFGADELALAVGYEGPVVIGVPWHRSMLKLPADGFLRPSGPVVGGHAVAVIGVSMVEHSFLIQNSWGRRWGVGGRAWISFADMGKLLKARGECCVPVRAARPLS